MPLTFVVPLWLYFVYIELITRDFTFDGLTRTSIWNHLQLACIVMVALTVSLNLAQDFTNGGICGSVALPLVCLNLLYFMQV